MPRLDYRAAPETILPGLESQIVLEVLVQELNRLREAMHQPPIREADVRKSLREAVQRRRQRTTEEPGRATR